MSAMKTSLTFGLVGALLIISCNPADVAARRERTRWIIKCIERGETNYFVANGRHPATLDECLAAVVMPEYWDDLASTPEIGEDIRARRDAWGRPLEFETHKMSDGIVRGRQKTGANKSSF
jgi:hypothetical protein